MKRFQMDRPVMVKRWRIEWEKHGRDFGNCHCGRGMGTMRKRRPYGSCGCPHCQWVKAAEKRESRTVRYDGRRECLADQESDAQG